MTPVAMPDAWIEGIGLRGPGLAGWSASIEVLGGRTPYVAVPTVLAPPVALPPAERRRVGKGVKVALEVGFEAATHAGRDPSSLPSVFASSSGDGDNCDAICRELAGDRMISPTRFHNSVHNAPSGYWGIASGSMESSTSLCAFDHSFVAGLDDALCQLAGGAGAVLLVAYDAPYPEPLRTTRPTPDSFGIAFVLTRGPGEKSLAQIGFETPNATRDAVTPMNDPTLEACRTAIPAARALPLLEAIAMRGPGRAIVLEGANGARVVLRVRATSPASTGTFQGRSACA